MANPLLPTRQKVVRLAHRPRTDIDPSYHLHLSYEPVPKFREEDDGKQKPIVLVHRLYLSLDPAMRGWMSSARSYLPPVQINDVMRGATLSEVLAVRGTTRLKVGDVVSEFAGEVGGWQEFAIVSARSVRRIETWQELLNNHEPIPRELPPLTVHLSILGTTGLTAYFGFIRVGCPRSPSIKGKRPEVVLVTAAAGAVGTVVSQIAKNVYGCKVIGVCGSDAKCKLLQNDLKCCDTVINYREIENEVNRSISAPADIFTVKSTMFQNKLRKALKEINERGLDIVFDNVGSYQLNECLSRLNPFARVAICGAISGYNNDLSKKQSDNTISSTAIYMKYGMSIISLRAKIQGFIVLDYIKEWSKAKKDLARWIVEGKIRYQQEDVRNGLENAPSALLDLFKGRNHGKLVVKVGERLVDKENVVSKL
jgi:NADPH-dependent curcumin reductase CurA